jgi:hypothetical protein
VTVQAVLFDGSNKALPNQNVTFLLDGTIPLGGGFTDSNGFATTIMDTYPLALNANIKAGTHTVTAQYRSLDSNYKTTVYAPSGSDWTMQIFPRPVTVTPNAQSKVYGDPDPGFDYTVTSSFNPPLMFLDFFSGALGHAGGENVGTHAIVQGTLAVGTSINQTLVYGNYAITVAPANLTISQRPITVTADARSKTYGDPDPGLTYKITSGNLAFTDQLNGALVRTPGEGVGTYAINQGFLPILNPNYMLTFAPALLTINPRPVTVTADAQSKVYGYADPPFTYKVTTGNLVQNDSFSGGLVRALGEDVGKYAISKGTLANSNYTITFAGANLTINPRPITVTADAESKTYGDTDPKPLTYKITGNLVAPDIISGILSRSPGENAGTYAIQNALIVSNNYAVTYVGALLTINPRPVTVTADAQSKVYGNVDPSFTYKVTTGNLVGNDSFSGAMGRAAGENIGPYAINQGSLANNNYAITFAGANLTITSRPVTVTADTQSKVYGSPDPPLTYKVTTGSLAFNDVFTGGLNRVPGETVGNYAIQQNSLALSANYTLTYGGANLTITRKPATVTAGSNTKVYGSADPALGTSEIGFLAADVPGIALSTTRAPGAPVGNYVTTATATGGAVNNYNIAYVPGNFSITPAPLTITANNVTRVYANSNPVLTATFTGLVNGDTVASVSGSPALSTAVISTTLPGAYPISIAIGTLFDPNYTFALIGGTFTVTPTGAAPPSGGACNGAYNGTFSGNLTVSDGQTCIFYAPGGGVTGNVQLKGGNLLLLGQTVGGNVQTQGNSDATITITGGGVGGNVQVQNNTGTIAISAVAITGDLQIHNSAGNVTLTGGKITGNLEVQNDSAISDISGVTVSNDMHIQNNTGAVQVFNNTIGNNLQCANNSSITGGGNTAKQKQGQCSAF